MTQAAEGIGKDTLEVMVVGVDLAQLEDGSTVVQVRAGGPTISVQFMTPEDAAPHLGEKYAVSVSKIQATPKIAIARKVLPS